MAKKRKAPRTFEQSEPKRVTKFDIEEKFDGSDDEFYAGRDKILLDESLESKNRRHLLDQEKDLQLSDEEILPYEDGTQDEDEEDDDEDDDMYDEDSNQINQQTRSRRHEDMEEDDGLSEQEHWGTTRADYYGDDVIETEEQAKAEEEEARRLHLKQLKNMTEADFGFDEQDWIDKNESIQSGKSITQKLPEARIPEGASEEQMQQILVSRYPEFLPLAEDFMRLQKMKAELDQTADHISENLQRGAKVDDQLPVAVKRDALNTYLATISMYLAVVSTTTTTKGAGTRKITAIPPLDLHDHPVIKALARARHLWDQVEPLTVCQIVTTSAQEQGRTESPNMSANVLSGKKVAKGSEEIEKQAKALKEPLIYSAHQKSTSGTRAVQEKVNDSKAQKRQRQPKKKTGKVSLDLDALLNQTHFDPEESDFGDEQPLTKEEYAEKARKRKSLRFYTSQIASKANKRGHASRDAGGDDDLPYKERQKDRNERLIREAEARGRNNGDQAGNFDDEDDDNTVPAQRDMNDDYYDTLLNANRQKKADKQARADAYAQAAREGAAVYEEETIGPDGKRAITYAIAKNKGLTPKRSKDVRNPRVKKRKKYDEKLKKLGSMRQIYKGGEGRGGYGGELTGIKTNIVKSIKL